MALLDSVTALNLVRDPSVINSIVYVYMYKRQWDVYLYPIKLVVFILG